MSSNLDDIKFLDEKFAELGIINFSGKEICNGWDVPEDLLRNIIPTVEVLQSLRRWYKNPIFISSSYRSPEYNRSVGGARKSMHLLFNAIDFTVSDKKDLNKLYLKLDAWDIGLTNYKCAFGIGRYKTFIHFDTRATLGFNGSRWKG
jgi:hypothetical protein